MSAPSSSSSSLAPTPPRTALKGTGIAMQTLKRAEMHQELSAQRRHEAHSKRRRGNDTTTSTGTTTAVAPEEKPSDAAIQATIDAYRACYIIPAISTSTSAATSVAPPSHSPTVPLAQRAAALQALRILLSSEDAPLTTIIAAGIVPLLILELSASSSTSGVDSTAATQMDALWCLTNLASGTSAHTRAVLPAAPALIALLSSSSSKVVEQCTWCLGNLAADDPACRRVLLENGVLVPLIRTLSHGVPQAASLPPMPHAVPVPNDPSALSLLQVTAWTLSNLVKAGRSATGTINAEQDAQRHAAAFAAAAPALLPVILTLLRSADTQLATESTWLLSAWANHSDAVLASLFTGGLIPALLSRLAILQSVPQAAVVIDPTTQVERDPLAPALIPIIRLFGNAAHAKDELVHSLLSFTFPVVAAGAGAPPSPAIPSAFHLVFSTLDRALSSIHRGLRKESCWCVANLAATGLKGVHEALIIGGTQAEPRVSVFLERLYMLLAKGNFDLQREAAHAIYNLSRAGDCALMHLVLPRDTSQNHVTLNVLKTTFEFLRSRDSEGIFIALRLIELILRKHPDGKMLVESNGGLDALECVPTQIENAALVAHAHQIMDEFFHEVDVDNEDEDLTSDASTSQMQEEMPAWRVQYDSTAPQVARVAIQQQPQQQQPQQPFTF